MEMNDLNKHKQKTKCSINKQPKPGSLNLISQFNGLKLPLTLIYGEILG